MNIQINAKVNSINELNTTYTFEPNQHGLYNISLLHRIFNEKKHELDKADPESWLNKFPEHYKEGEPTAHERSSKLFLVTFADNNDLLMADSNGDYWCNADTFAFLLKGASPLYADAVNNLESGKCVSYKDFAIELSKKYSVYFPQKDDTEGYRAYCIHQVAKLFRNLESTYDFTVALTHEFDRVIDKANVDYDAAIFQCWKIAFTNINNLIGDLMKFDPKLEDYEGFMLRYRSALTAIREEVTNLLPANPVAPVTPTKETVGKKVDKFLRKWF
ncbi:hypothetical protein ABDC18_002848 [Escherichia coli]